jgi:hypothetical protein
MWKLDSRVKCSDFQTFLQLTKFLLRSQISSQALVAHAWNPSYLRGSNQEDCGLKPAQANSLRDPILKKPITQKKA